MKKLKAFLVLALSFVVSAFAWVGCSDPAPAACAHTGGTATCKEKAVCALCGEEYGELNAENHASAEFTYTANENGTHAKKNACCGAVVDEDEACSGGEATCKDKAVCSLCETAYGEVDADKHTSEETKIVSNNDGTHSVVKVCCEEVISTDNCLGGDAKCQTLAICDTCNAAYGDFDKAVHESEEFTYVDNEDGTHSKKMSCCGTVVETAEHVFAEEWTQGEDSHYKLCVCGAKGEEATHEYEYAATETEHFEECSVCEKQINNAAHEAGEWEEKDEDNHWKLCECGWAMDEAAHSYAWKIGETQNSYQCECGKVGLRDGEPFVVTTADDTAYELHAEVETFDLLAALGGEEAEIVYQIGMFELEPLSFTFNGQDVTEAFANDTENVPVSIFGDARGEQVVKMVLFSGSMGGDDYFEHVCEIKFNIVEAGDEGHAVGEVWQSDENNHWKLCECGLAISEAAHSYAWKVGETQNSYQCDCGKVALRDGEPFVVTTADDTAFDLDVKKNETFDLLAALGGEESEIVCQIGMFELEPLSFTFNGQDVTEAFANDTENVPVSIFGSARGEQIVEMVLFSGSMGGDDYFEHICEIKFNLTANETMKAITLNLDLSADNGALKYGKENVEIDVTEVTDIETLSTVTYKDNEVEYTVNENTLTIPAATFGKDWGEVSLVLTTNGTRWELPVLLISKVLKSAEDVQNFGAIAKLVGNGNVTQSGYFTLGNNIDFNDYNNGVYIPYLQRNQFNPSWGSPATVGFNGVFDGCGYTISNITIGDGATNSNASGFIPVLHVDGIIRNVAFVNAKANMVGLSGILTSVAGGLIENIYVQLAWSSTNGIGVLFRTDKVADRDNVTPTVKDVFVDVSAATYGANNTSFDATGQLYALGGSVTTEAFGKYEGAYVLVKNSGSAKVNNIPNIAGKGGAAEGSVYGGFLSADELEADTTAQAELATWNTAYWTITNGVPVWNTLE